MKKNDRGYRMNGRVLVVAGSDSGGGAGIQADVKTITVLGGFATTAITALTAQNTKSITSVQVMPAHFVAEQMRVVISDIGVDCIKTGMLQNRDIIEAVVEVLGEISPKVPLIVDPVMISKSGVGLLEKDAQQALISQVFPLLDLITPNIPEAEVFSGKTISCVDDMLFAVELIKNAGARAVLLKGGHLDGDTLFDVLVCDEGEFIFQDKRIDSINTHGTGCTLSSAIAVGIAHGLGHKEAVIQARNYLRKAIIEAPDFGSGHGPVNHGVTLK